MTTTTDTTQPRQTVTVSLHLGREYGRFAPEVSPAAPDQHIAAVDVANGLRLQTDDPSIFRDLAQAFLAAADSIVTATQPVCTECARRLHEEDPSNTGLGRHVDCTSDGALAGQPS